MKKLLIAKNEQGKLVLAWQACDAENYFCPECGETVGLRSGRYKEAYFAHHRQSTCINDVGESNLHLLGKQQMWQWANHQGWRPSLEVYLPTIQQRPDLLLTYFHQRIAMEFQCSPLSCERLIERNNGYRKLGLGFVWYLGPAYHRHLGKAKRAQFVQKYKDTPALFWWDINRHGPVYQPLRLTSLANKVQLLKQLYQLQRYPRSYLKLRAQVYQTGHLLNLCPLVGHCNEINTFLLQHSDFEWRVQLLLWLGKMPLHYSWTPEEWLRALDQRTLWQTCPCLTTSALEELQKRHLIKFTQDLVGAQIIGSTSFGYFLRQRPNWFADVGEKVTVIAKLSE